MRVFSDILSVKCQPVFTSENITGLLDLQRADAISSQKHSGRVEEIDFNGQ